MRSDIVILLSIAQATLVSCLRLPPDDKFEDYQPVDAVLGQYSKYREPVLELDRPRPSIICDQRLPQMRQDVLQAHEPQFRDIAGEPLAKNIRALRGMRPSTCNIIKGFMKEGLTWNGFGMDFSKLFKNRSRSANETIEVIRNHFLPYYWASAPQIGQLMEMDHRGRWSVRQMPTIASSYFQKNDAELFRRDGFLKFENLGVDLSLLRKQVDFHLGLDSSIVKAKGVRLEGMEPIVRNERLRDLASYYLGTPAAMTGYKILRLKGQIPRDKYLSGYWHHDACGTRLKLFLFMEDVKEDGMTTEIAPGTQNTLHFAFRPTLATRYSDEYVTSHLRTEKMTGPAGGGFIFDTNTVHKGNVDGINGVPRSKRDAIVVEYGAADKLEAHVPSKGPCPEPGTYTGDSEWSRAGA